MKLPVTQNTWTAKRIGWNILKGVSSLGVKQDIQFTYNITMRHVHITIVGEEKQSVLNIMSVCLYSCLSYSAWKSHAFCAILSCMVCLAVQYFSTLSQKWHDLRNSYWTLPEVFLILRRIHWYVIVNVHTSSHEVFIIPVAL